MNCKKCGEENAEGAKFCNGCGSALEETDIQKVGDRNEESTANNYAQSGNKNSLPLLLSIAGLLVIAVVVLVMFLVNGSNIDGKWYNPSLDQIIEFRANEEVVMHTPSGSFLGTYTFDSRNNDGTVTFGGIAGNFVVEDDKVILENGPGGSQTYIKMDDGIDIESMINMQENPTEAVPNIENTPTQDVSVSMEATPTVEITAAPTPTPGPTDTPFVPTPPPETPTATPVITETPTNTPLVFATLFTGIILYNPVADIEGTWESQFTTDDSVYTFYDDYEFTYHPGGLAILTTGTYTYDNATNTGEMTADGTYYTTPFEYDESSDMIYVNGINPYVRQP